MKTIMGIDVKSISSTAKVELSAKDYYTMLARITALEVLEDEIMDHVSVHTEGEEHQWLEVDKLKVPSMTDRLVEKIAGMSANDPHVMTYLVKNGYHFYDPWDGFSNYNWGNDKADLMEYEEFLQAWNNEVELVAAQKALEEHMEEVVVDTEVVDNEQ